MLNFNGASAKGQETVGVARQTKNNNQYSMLSYKMRPQLIRAEPDIPCSSMLYFDC